MGFIIIFVGPAAKHTYLKKKKISCAYFSDFILLQSPEDLWSNAYIIGRILSNLYFPLVTFAVPKQLLNLPRISKISMAPSLSQSWEPKKRTFLQILACLAYNM